MIRNKNELCEQESIYRKFRFLRHPINLTLLILLLSSCATTPTNRFVRTNPQIWDSLSKTTSIGVINDICLLRDDVGDDYYSIEDSKSAAALMLQGVKTYLMQTKHYQVNFQLSPTVCAFKDSDEKLNAAQQQGLEAFYQNPPLFISESVKKDHKYEQALIHLIKRVQKSITQNEHSPSELFSEDDKMPASLKTIAAQTNTELLLVITSNGVVVSTGKAVGQAILTTVATLGTIAVWKASFLNSYVALVDLKKRDILWSNSLRFKEKGTNKNFYLNKWAQKVLYHFPPNK